MEKADIRKAVREKKRTVPLEEKLQRSRQIMQAVAMTESFHKAKVVLLYWSMADEVQTHEFVEQCYRKKTVLLPCVDGDNLRLRQYTGPDCIVSGEQFGIGEPIGPEWTNLNAVQLVVVPGVAFDPTGNRMGRGRGFYDRLLMSTHHAIKIGVAFGFQIFDEIPVEPHDVKMDFLIHD